MPRKTRSKETARTKEDATADPSGTDSNVPEWAESMEHTLRRLMREKARERAKNPGLYR